MNQPRFEACPAYAVSIFIAGDLAAVKNACRLFCDKEGLCVTVTPTTYVYTGGQEDGVIVGLINYPRFPAEPGQIYAIADALAEFLRIGLGQDSFTVQTPDAAFWTSWRKEDAQGGVTGGRDGEAGSGSEASSTRSSEAGCALSPSNPSSPTTTKRG